VEASANEPVRVVGRYALFGEIASGGMATVHFGRLLGSVGFARTVAIKRLHPHLSKDPDFSAMFLDEARLAARIQHPNVVSTLDIVALDGELFLVMEYVDGESLAKLLRTTREKGALVDPRIAVAIISGALHGLHAAHEAKNERGEPLNIVHRDVSPQNILVGRDGSARVLDFGVAKAAGRLHETREGSVKGKVPYMPPEQLRSGAVDCRTDVYAAAVVLWETLTARKLFRGDNDAAVLEKVLFGEVEPPSKYAPNVPPELDALVLKGLAREPNDRYATAREMALALERTMAPALTSDVGDWVKSIASDTLSARATRVAEIESGTSQVNAAVAGVHANDVTQSAADISAPLAAVSGSHAAVSGAHAAAALASTPSLVSLVSSPGEPPSSQVSSISVARGDAPRPRRGRLVGVAAVGALVLVAAAGVLVVVLKSHDSTPSAAGTASSISASPEHTPPPKPSAAASIEVPASATVSAAASVTATASAVASARPKPTAKPPPPSDDCKIPYTVDSTGTMIYKRQCL